MIEFFIYLGKMKKTDRNHFKQRSGQTGPAGRNSLGPYPRRPDWNWLPNKVFK